MSFTTQLIAIRTHAGEMVTIDAQVSGHFAIHLSPIGGLMFTVTHVPTGCALAQGLPNAQARAVVAQAQTMTDLDWSRSDVAYFDTAEIRAITARLAAFRDAR